MGFWSKLFGKSNSIKVIEKKDTKMKADEKQLIDAFFKEVKNYLEENPNDPDAHSMLASEYHKRGKLDEAVNVLKKAVDLIPNEPILHYNLATMLAQQDKLEEAVEQYKVVIEYDYDHADAHWYLAAIYYNAEKYSEAKKEALQAKRLNHPQAQRMLDALEEKGV